MNSIPVLTVKDVAMLDGVLGDFLKKAEADLTVVIDRGGNVISQFGDMSVMDVTIFAALAAGSFAATCELARRIGEIEFNALYHQGNGSHMFMNSVDDDTIMITVFGRRTTVGLVRFYATSTAQSVGTLLRSLSREGHGFAFDASDVSKELWNSRQDASRDDVGTFAKFNTPTIANGKVYVPTFSGYLAVYGLLPPTRP